MKKILYLILGCIGVGLGALGAILPLLPAFPFLLLAAFCFAKSSHKLHNWFIHTKLYKQNLESFAKGQGMTIKTKLRIMLIVTATMAVGFFMMSQVPVGRAILLCVWIMHLFIFFFAIKTKKENPSFCKILHISGMHCDTCAHRVKCALERHPVKADIDFKTQTAKIYFTEPLENHVLIEAVRQAGYQVDNLTEEAS